MYALNTSWLWEWWLELLAVLLMLSAFYEPAASVSSLTCERDSRGTAMKLAEAVCLGCFLLDIYTKFAYMRRQMYFSKPWHSYYLLVVGALLLDALLGGACAIRPFRFLRPLLIFLRNREQRRVLTSLVHLISHQLAAACCCWLAPASWLVRWFALETGWLCVCGVV